MEQHKVIKQKSSLFGVLSSYKMMIFGLIVLTVVANGLNLVVPKLIASAIDGYTLGSFNLSAAIIEFSLVAVGISVLTYLQGILQIYAAEKVAKDLRRKTAEKISKQDYRFIDTIGPAKLLTNLTSDIDAVKNFVSQAISSLISSVFLIIGASVLLILTNWKLALAVLAVLPIVGITFYIVFGKVKKLFKKSQESIDWLNKVINESILGAALIRLSNAQMVEYQKFSQANGEARDLGLKILTMFAVLIPVITFATNLAVLIILVLGGHFVIGGSMSIGDFTAFNSYLSILIFPVIIIGFMSSVIAQSQASFSRVAEVLDSEERKDEGTVVTPLKGEIEVRNVTLTIGEKTILKDVSFKVAAGSKSAIIGPTAGGKTQLLYAMVGLVEPTSGTVLFDGIDIKEYKKEKFHEEVGFVFQDSIIFNLSVRENIAFSTSVTNEDLKKAIDTAELADFISALPEGLDTVVSERGSTLSGGQKQRIMLARALALDPKILLLDDFTARVDLDTERKILKNIEVNYPNLTLVSVTQKIASVEHYDEVVLLMEGEVLATGPHSFLVHNSPEYVQIYESQKSTEVL